MKLLSLLLLFFFQTAEPDKVEASRERQRPERILTEGNHSLREEVDDFPKFVVLSCHALADDPWNHSLRRLWNQIQEVTEYPDSLQGFRNVRFRWHDLIPAWLWCLGLFSASAWLACDLVRKRLGLLRYSLFIPLAIFILSLSCFALQIARDYSLHSFFKSPLVVLKESTSIRQGNSTFYPVRLSAPFPPGHALRLTHEGVDWYQVEFALGDYGWVPKSAAIRVVPSE